MLLALHSRTQLISYREKLRVNQKEFPFSFLFATTVPRFIEVLLRVKKKISKFTVWILWNENSRHPTHKNMVMQYRHESMWECKCADIKSRKKIKYIFKSQPFKCNKSISFPPLDISKAMRKKNFLNKMQNWFLIDLFDVYIEKGDYWMKCWKECR